MKADRLLEEIKRHPEYLDSLRKLLKEDMCALVDSTMESEADEILRILRLFGYTDAMLREAAKTPIHVSEEGT